MSPDSYALEALTWPEAGRLLARDSRLLFPVGAFEQHGPHLPLGTDTDIASALCTELASRRADVLVAPAVAYGSSGEHAGFPGTLSIGGPALTTVVVELVRSADAFRGVVLVCGHGGNLAALRAAVDVLGSEGRRVLLWAPTVPAGDAHAGRTETSIMLALDPDAVRLDEAEAGSTRPLVELMPELRTGGVAAVSPNGVLGDPAGASVEEGRHLIGGMVADLTAAVEAWLP
jgi:creatinine amidohydrolase